MAFILTFFTKIILLNTFMKLYNSIKIKLLKTEFKIHSNLKVIILFYVLVYISSSSTLDIKTLSFPSMYFYLSYYIKKLNVLSQLKI